MKKKSAVGKKGAKHSAGRLSRIYVTGGEADGRKVDLCLETEGGQKLTIDLDRDSLRTLITELTTLGYQMAQARTKGVPVDLKDGHPVDLSKSVSVTGVAVATGTDKSIHLLLRLLDFDLTYQVASPDLQSIAKSLGQAALALDAPDHTAN